MNEIDMISTKTEQCSTHTLSNGARVILVPLQHTRTITALVLFGVGSRYEEKRINGISHFIEHMMFKGTERRPSTLAISKELDGVGAEYNAYTSKDHTGYYVKLDASHGPLALDIVSDMLFNSLFAPEEIEREKKVICEEIHMYKDNPVMYIDNLLEQGMFHPSSLGWDIAGDDSIVTALSRDNLISYMREFYRPENVVIGIAGNMDPVRTQDMISQLFGRMWGEQGAIAAFDPFAPQASSHSRIQLLTRDTEQVQLALGFYGKHYLHQDIHALTLLSVILGGTMSSRLFISIRERLGLCYSIKALHQPYQDTGSFMIIAGLDRSRIKEAITAILKELQALKKEGVTEEEVQRAKDYLAGKVALQLEDSENVVSWYATQEILTEEVLTPEEKLAKLSRVTLSDIQRVAGELFTQEALSLAVIGPYQTQEACIPDFDL